MFHLDLTSDNILFRVPETLRRWSDTEVYSYMGRPVTGEVRTCGREPRSIHAPLDLIEPIDASKFLHESHLQEAVTVIDYGQSYAIASPPRDYKPVTRVNYMSPELAFEERICLETDVWSLGCAIFEIRAGRPLFDSFFNSDVYVLVQIVQTLGRLPDPWWGSFEGLIEDRTPRFREDHGEPKSIKAQERAGHILQPSKSSIGDELRSIGSRDDPPYSDEGPMMEKSGVRLDKDEAELLEDLLRKMLRYRPEERIGMREVVEHPWFEFGNRP
jgi:serine/threonine protein kinase